MENSEVLEDLDSWEVIPSPYTQQQPSSLTQVGEEDLAVFVKENFYDGSAVFPPSEHEGLEVSKEESLSSSFSGCSQSDDEELQKTPKEDSLLDVTVWMGKQMRLGISSLSGRIFAVASFFWPCAASRFWKFDQQCQRKVHAFAS